MDSATLHPLDLQVNLCCKSAKTVMYIVVKEVANKVLGKQKKKRHKPWITE